MTVEALKDCNKKYLAQMAKDQGIVGWHAMRKDQLIRALSLAAGGLEEGRRQVRGGGRNCARRREPPTAARRPATAGPAPRRPLTVMPPRALDHACVKDRIVVMVRDPYWLHAYWELSRSHAGPGAGRPGAGVAHGPADPPPDGRHQRGHDQPPPSGTSATSRSTAA